MKLFEIIDDIDEFIIQVAKDCQPFLKTKKPGQVLYRGMRNVDKRFLYYKKVRKNRISSNTPKLVSNKIDDFFVREFGIPFRSQSIFTTSAFYDAQFYGPAYSVYPVGQFNFLWSQRVDDLYGELNRLVRTKYHIQLDAIPAIVNIPKEQQENAHKFMNDLDSIIESFNYKNTNLIRAIKSKNEVMISVDTYHARNTNGYKETAIEIDNKIYEYMESKK